MKLRKYPVGIQSFETIRRDGYIYIDKTPLIYKMISEGKPYFLSRPRRFGKSLLCSTLAAVFEGRRELFEAFTTDDGVEQPQLFIATTNWRWEKHPVYPLPQLLLISNQTQHYRVLTIPRTTGCSQWDESSKKHNQALLANFSGLK